MIQVKNTKAKLCVLGHAAASCEQVSVESRDVCVSVTAMMKMMLAGFTRVCPVQPPMTVSSGKFVLDKHGLSKEGLLLVAIFVDAVKDLVCEYPEYIRLYGENGQEWFPDGDSMRKNCSCKPLFPDWREFQV